MTVRFFGATFFEGVAFFFFAVFLGTVDFFEEAAFLLPFFKVVFCIFFLAVPFLGDFFGVVFFLDAIVESTPAFEVNVGIGTAIALKSF